MQVMKFGGASVRDAAGVRNVVGIIQQHAGQGPLLVVVSAMDKTTNALEELAARATSGQAEATAAQLAHIRDFHLRIAEGLFGPDAGAVQTALSRYLGELDQTVQGILLLGEYPPRIYDRIMAYGELMSSVIVHAALQAAQVDAVWLDARQVVTTDTGHGQAEVVWRLTQELIDTRVRPLLAAHAVVLTQGYIASTTEGRTTTLGREGSDYTASIFAYGLDAARVVIWKDVPGVMSADPRQDPDVAKPIAQLSYESAVEMTFYGASVIHPKTIKPLHNKGIPLHVRSFVDTSLAGTVIQAAQADVPAHAARIHKRNQALLLLQPRDFSFVEDRHLQTLIGHARTAGLGINLLQTSAISLTLCVDAAPEALEAFASAVADAYSLHTREGLRLTTLLYTREVPPDLPQDDVLLMQRGPQHLHLVRPQAG